MKIVLAIGLTIALFAAINIKAIRKYLFPIMAAYVGVMILLFILYNYRTVERILPMYHPKDQVFYQREFIDAGGYPDSILPYILNGKTVYIKNDSRRDKQENALITGNASDESGKYWMYNYHHFANEVNFLEACGAKVVIDDKLNDIDIDVEMMNDFEDLGAVNDMYRYMFMLARGDEEWWNAFYYYWYYCNFLKERDPDGMHMYICADDIAEKDELIVLWNDLESKDLFLMSKDMLEKEAGL